MDRRRTLGPCLAVCVAMFVGSWLGCGNESPPRAAEPASPPAEKAVLTGRVLFIGIDGCRYDCLDLAKAPNLKKLRDAGCYADDTLIQGTRYKASDTVSGPGWSSLLTGVWADKHGVDDNRFTVRNFDKYPMFFRRVRQADPKAELAAFSNWPPISERIVVDADLNLKFATEWYYASGDRETAAAAVDLLRRGNPRATFAYFGQVDAHGHEYGFSSFVPQYMEAIERTDGLVGTVLDALERRPNYKDENWLVLVSTDHGGFNNDHRDGHNKPQVMRGFTIVSGAAAAKGKLTEQTYIVDVPVTALTHMGVTIKPEWKLDGRAVGLKRP